MSDLEPGWNRVVDQEAVGQAGTDSDGGAAWISTDGVTWHRAAAGLDQGVPAGVIFDRVGYVAWGWAGDRAAVWVSSDGEAWTKAPDIPDSREVSMVTVIRRGDDLLAVGSSEGESDDPDTAVAGPRIWVSRDGLAWEPLPSAEPPANGSSLWGLTSAGDALIGWGSVADGDSHRPVSFRSTDGRSWQIGGTGLRAEGYATEGILDVVQVGERIVAVGHGLQGEAGSPPPSAAAWTSTDGLTWTPADLSPRPPTGWFNHVVWDGDGYVAVGGDGVESFVWRSVDGTDWTAMASAPDTGREGEEEGCTGGRCPRTQLNDVVVGLGRIVAVGMTQSDESPPRCVVWAAPIELGA